MLNTARPGLQNARLGIRGLDILRVAPLGAGDNIPSAHVPAAERPAQILFGQSAFLTFARCGRIFSDDGEIRRAACFGTGREIRDHHGGSRVQRVRDASDARRVQIFNPSQDRAGPEVDGNAVLGVATQSERRHL